MPKTDLNLSLPVMNAAGFLGFAPDLRGSVDLNVMGAFVTNPISLEPRSPAHNRCCLAYPGGFLLHTGHPNMGFRSILRKYAARWGRSPIHVIVHILALRVDEVAWMVHQLEAVPGVMAVELGLPPGGERALARDLVQAAQGELPVIAHPPLEEVKELAPTLSQAGAAGISLGPPRGVLPLADGKSVSGRLYGPAIFPQVLAVSHSLVDEGLSVIAAGGIYSTVEIDALLSAGAKAVQLDGILWRRGFDIGGGK